MLNKLLLSLFLSGVLLSSCNKPKCEEIPCPEKPKVITLKECSPHLQALIQNNKSHIRGVQVGMPLSAINEVDSNFVSNTSFYTSFSPDLDINYWAQIDYYFDENNIIDKVETEIIPGGLTKNEDILLVDSIYSEMREYLSGKYGNSVTNTDLKLIWNEVDLRNNSLTIFSLDYDIPETPQSFYENKITGKIDTVDNSPTVKYVVKFLE
tara:strand:+ start:1928 stop:2554 length:627 start_codon:yes stop_codon:yes gene_type:complete